MRQDLGDFSNSGQAYVLNAKASFYYVGEVDRMTDYISAYFDFESTIFPGSAGMDR